MRTPEVKRVAKRQCFQKDNARKATWKFPSVETDCFQLIFLVLISVSCCPHCRFISHYFCASWPVQFWCTVAPAKSRDSLFVVAVSPPSLSPGVLPVVSQTKQWQRPPVLCRLLDFQMGKCMHFPPQLHFGRLAPGWGAVFCSPLCLCGS